MVHVAADEDPVDDPSAVWPQDRETVDAGILEVTGAMALEETSEPLVFDPMRLTDGIEPSNDPVLQFRPRAYAVSAQRRSAGGA